MKQRNRMVWACYAALYDALWADPLGRELANAIVAFAGSHGLVADIGAGTGLIGSRFPALRYKVIFIDSSASMLRRAPGFGNISALVGQAEQLPLRTHSVDVVVAANLLHLHHEPLTALWEMLRICKPTGRIVCSWPSDNVGPWTLAATERRLGLPLTATIARVAGRLSIGTLGLLAGAHRTSEAAIRDAFDVVTQELSLRIEWHQLPSAAQTIVVLRARRSGVRLVDLSA